MNILSVVGAAAIGALLAWFFASGQDAAPPPSPPPPPIISLQEMGHLTSVNVSYANVIEFSRQKTLDIPWTQWKIPTGDTKVILVARGDCLVGTDLRLAKYENLDSQAKTVDVALSLPGTISSRVSHVSKEEGGSYFYAVNARGMALLTPNDRTEAIEAALALAQKEIGQACGASGVLATAKKNTEAVLAPIFTALGWKVQVRWPSGPQ